MSSLKNKTIVIGTIGADAHNVGIWLIRYSLQKEGAKVVNVGVCASQEDFIKAAIETDAQAIAVSSIYGHAFLDCQGFRQKCIETGLKDIRLYIGGNLTVGQADWEATRKTFLDLGFDRVYGANTVPAQFIADLKKDLNEKSRAKSRA